MFWQVYQSLDADARALSLCQTIDMAEQALRDEFDIREFHDVVLGGGALPLNTLQKRVRIFVDSKAH